MIDDRAAFASGEWTRSFPAPGKLNLMLRITGRRADGFHLLQTVFQFIDRCDWLAFRRRNDNEIIRTGGLDAVPQNIDLIVRAARLLRGKRTDLSGVEIGLKKNLPIGGGVGGGSSDAATTLCVLNKLWDLNYSFEALMQMGLTLGADVPVFIKGQAAWAEGVGEELVPMVLDEPWFVVLVPDCHVSTKEVFSVSELTRNNIPITMEKFISGTHNNDCLQVVTSRYEAVARALEALSRFGEARLTGTGGCVYTEFPEKVAAEEVAKTLSGDWKVFVARGINRSPLHEVLGDVRML